MLYHALETEKVVFCFNLSFLCVSIALHVIFHGVSVHILRILTEISSKSFPIFVICKKIFKI